MTNPQDDDSNSIGRRNFLKSVFGLKAASATQAAVAAAPSAADSFFWVGLADGMMGFPTGVAVPAGMPGSLMKIVTAATLRKHGLFGKDKHGDNEHLECRGSITIKHHKFVCLHAHGKVDLVHAIAWSCNVFFAQAASHISPDTIIAMSRQFLLDRPIAGRGPRAFPARAHGEPYLYALGLAEDLQPNALQIMRMAALVAQSGHLVPFRDPGQAPALAPTAGTAGDTMPGDSSYVLDLPDGTWSLLQQGMHLAAREGTGKSLDPDNKLHVAIKTGTTPHGKTFQSWVTGYFPFEKPRYAFCLRSQAGTSMERAIPAARRHLFAVEWP